MKRKRLRKRKLRARRVFAAQCGGVARWIHRGDEKGERRVEWRAG